MIFIHEFDKVFILFSSHFNFEHGVKIEPLNSSLKCIFLTVLRMCVTYNNKLFKSDKKSLLNIL